MNSMKIPKILIAIGALCLFVSCSDEKDAAIWLSTSAITVGPAGGQQTVSINTSEGNFRTEKSDEWYTVTEHKNRIVFEFDANPESEARFSVLTITSGNLTTLVHLAQEGAMQTTLTTIPDQQTIRLYYGGGKYTMLVSTTADSWEISSVSDWFTAAKNEAGTGLTIGYDKNIANESLQGSLVITAIDQNRSTDYTFNISQCRYEEDPYYCFIGEWDLYADSWHVIAEGGNQTVYDQTLSGCTISEGIPYETLEMSGLFIAQMELPHIIFNPEDGSISIPMIRFVASDEDYSYYLVQTSVNADSWDFLIDNLTGRVSEDRDIINLDGFAEGYGMGVVARSGMSYYMFYNMVTSGYGKTYFKKNNQR